jgi:tetratricopeptide (TPR) repeat protein
MKHRYDFILFCLLVLNGNQLHAQKEGTSIFFCGYSDNNTANDLCDYLQNNSFLSNLDAENAVGKILSAIGLPRNFVLVSCPKIKNAVAITSDNGLRYIIYDNEFMASLNRSTTSWSSLSILAHEIGHHLCGHTLARAVDLADQRKRELEADEFSGFVMYKLGATLQQSEAASKDVSNDNDDTYSTHPKRSKRVEAIDRGYNKAKNQKAVSNIDYSRSAEQYYKEGNDFFEQMLYMEAIDKYTLALKINPNFAFAYCNRGTAKIKIEDYSALDDYNEAIRIAPDLAVAYRCRGAAKYTLRDYSGSLKDLSQGIELDPNNADASTYYNRGCAKFNLKDYYGALADYTQAIQLNPQDILFYHIRGKVKLKLKDYSGALIDFNNAIKPNSEYADADTYNDRGLAKYYLMDYNGACLDFSKSCNIDRNGSGCNSIKEYCK